MSKPLKISILDRTDTEEFKQLTELLKEFTIETYIENKPEYATLKNVMEYVNIAIQEFNGKITPSMLSPQDIEQIKQDIDSQISMAKELIDKKQTENTQTRYYIMKEGDKSVAFQQGQIAKGKENSRIEGWSNLAYTDPEYRGEGQVINSKGIMQKGGTSKLLFEDLRNWFEENGVNYERTCTGVNMIRNIKTYIRLFGYLPFSKNDKNIFLEKSEEHKIDAKTLNKVIKLYEQHKGRTERKNKDEIMTEIDSITEFASLTEEQKSGLVQCFLKENEKKFEIPNDKLKMLNDFIQENLQNRKNSTNYDLLYRISGMMTKDFKIKDRHFDSITKPSTIEETKEIALQFFKELDQELYEKVKGVIEGNSKFAFNMYMLDENEDFSLTDNDGMPIHSKTPRVMERNGKAGIYVPCKGTLEDIYLLVHELSHTFDYVEGTNDPVRNMLGEVTPHCFEAMLSQYMLEKGIVTREDVTNREKGTTISHYDDGVETFAKFQLMKLKEQNGDISQEDINQMQKKYGITNKQLGYVLGRMAGSEPTIDYRARYMTAQLIYPHFMKQYEQNPQNAIMTLKEYFEQIKSNNFIGSLQTLGIEPREASIQDLIKTANTRFDNLEKTKQFSTQQIGKATINTTTQIKDKAREQVARDEQQILFMENIKEIKQEKTEAERISFFHDQKSDEFFEDMQTGRYNITEQQSR